MTLQGRDFAIIGPDCGFSLEIGMVATPFANRSTGKGRWAIAAMIAAMAVGALPSGHAAAAGPPVEPFSEFVQELATAPAAAIVGEPGAAVESEPAFAEMRRYLLKIYNRMSPSHSYAQGDQVFDCMPLDQQPGLRLQGLTEIAEPPPISALPIADMAPDRPGSAEMPTPPVECESGTIPMRRVTLDELARFRTLQAFLSKGPGGAGLPYGTMPLLRDGEHGYAHEYSFVKNYGGSSFLSVYAPKVITTAPKREIFSLAQHWYVGGVSASLDKLQTAEVGWQNYPRKYGTNKSVLFIYWTADGYLDTGCYNLDCAAFIQTSNKVALGGSVAPYSVVGGPQYEINIGYYLYKGDWWLIYNGNPIGYYRVSIYRGGQLSRFAQEIDMGGETVGYPDWPAMGSGNFASAGYRKAAYNRAIEYRDAENVGHQPRLTVSQPSPACWTATSHPPAGGSGWGRYFYFGGPGGKFGTC